MALANHETLLDVGIDAALSETSLHKVAIGSKKAGARIMQPEFELGEYDCTDEQGVARGLFWYCPRQGHFCSPKHALCNGVQDVHFYVRCATYSMSPCIATRACVC